MNVDNSCIPNDGKQVAVRRTLPIPYQTDSRFKMSAITHFTRKLRMRRMTVTTGLRIRPESAIAPVP